MRRVLCLLPALAVLVVPTASGAAWSSSATGTAAIGATTMTNASGFTAACAATNKTKGVVLSWTASPDAFVEHYDIVRSSAAGGASASFRVGRDVTTLTDNPPNNDGMSYTYTIRAGSTQMVWTTALLTASGTPTYTASKCVTA